ncbi:MAG: hypothetical protein HQM13_18220 [SAR324 cluster bacterium]|nr:hypothetical protein [SAR324 cluster bacterium]
MPSINDPFHWAPLQPHGEVKQIFENIWFVQGQVRMPMMFPMKISRSMTIIKDLQEENLTLINSMRLSDSALAELEKIGKITSVIRIAGYHGRDDAFYKDTFQAKVYAIEGQTYSRKMEVSRDVRSGFMQADVWLNENSELPVKNSALKIIKSCHPPEAVLLVQQEGGILITGDTLQNTPKADEFVNFPAKLMMKKMGFYKPCNVGPAWLQFAKPDRGEVRSLLDLDFEHVLPAHGEAVLDDAKNKFRPVLEGDLKGCHEK